MDVEGDNSGNIGFWSCTGSFDPSIYPYYDNQAFVYDNATGVFTQHLAAGQAPVCVTYVDGSLVQVWVYTNGDEVELFLNGEPQGVQSVPAFEKASFAVAYKPGNLTAVARKAGKAWAADTVGTPGAPSVVKLEVEPLIAMIAAHGGSSGTAHGTALRADGQDAMLLTARVEDAAGNVQHHSSGAEQPVVTFTVAGEGTLIGVGSGDPSEHSSDKADHRRAFNGLVRGIVQASKTAGSIKVTASAPGLQSSTVELITEAVLLLEA